MDVPKLAEKSATPWTAFVPADECRPLGPDEARAGALAALGPFQWKTDDEFDLHGPLDRTLPVSEESAIRGVDELQETSIVCTA
jgi:hypothetical protein